jgi:hypothetical protein
MLKKITTLVVVLSCTLSLVLSPVRGFSSAVTGETTTVANPAKNGENVITACDHC